jgi:peroxiredoxin Q/BCP
MLNPGSKAPGFVLQNDLGDEISLTELLRDGPLILYFYPADFTPGCTLEACSIRDIHDDLVAVGLNVAGVSPQSPSSHERFREANNLPFVLLSDPDKAVIKMYGVDGPLGFGVRRSTFLIDQDGLIEDAITADIRIGLHEDFIQKAIALRR